MKIRIRRWLNISNIRVENNFYFVDGRELVIHNTEGITTYIPITTDVIYLDSGIDLVEDTFLRIALYKLYT